MTRDLYRAQPAARHTHGRMKESQCEIKRKLIIIYWNYRKTRTKWWDIATLQLVASGLKVQQFGMRDPDNNVGDLPIVSFQLRMLARIREGRLWWRWYPNSQRRIFFFQTGFFLFILFWYICTAFFGVTGDVTWDAYNTSDVWCVCCVRSAKTLQCVDIRRFLVQLTLA